MKQPLEVEKNSYFKEDAIQVSKIVKNHKEIEHWYGKITFNPGSNVKDTNHVVSHRPL